MIRLALIGTGRWGQKFISTVSKMDSCRITHLCAKTWRTLDSFPNSFQKTNHYQDLLKIVDIDGAIIATPASTHFLIAKEFLARGIPLLVEKPFTTSHAEARSLQKKMKENSKLMVGHEYLFNPAYLVVKKMVLHKKGIQFIHTQAGAWGPFRRDTSCLWDWGPHDVAMIIDLLGGLPKSVSAWGIGDDVVWAKFSFASGISVVSHLSRLNPLKIRQMTISFRYQNILYDELADKKVTVYYHKNSAIEYPQYAEKSALEEEIKAFVDYIKDTHEPLTNIKHATGVIKILETLDASLRNEGKTMHI